MKRKTRRYYIYYLAKTLIFLVSFIPRQLSIFLADKLAICAFLCLTKYRNIAIENLKKSLDLSSEESFFIARDVFRNLAKNGVDWINLIFWNKKKINSLVNEVSGIAYLDEAIKKGNGVILMASHFGNWELLSTYLWANGYKGIVIAKKIYFHKYNKFVESLRSRFGGKVLYRNSSIKDLIKVLKRGEIIGVLADQDVDSVEGEFVKFFGKLAYTPTAPVRLGMLTNASLVKAFMVRKKDNTYKLIIEKPIELLKPDQENKEDKEKFIVKYTQQWTNILEKYVRMYPEQWVWIHKRWKTKVSNINDLDKK